MTARRPIARSYPTLEGAMTSAGLRCVRRTTGYDAWAANDSARVHVLVYDDGHWVVWDDDAMKELSTGRSSVHLTTALRRAGR